MARDVVIALTGGFLAGLASAPHCAVMCGPLCAYACRARSHSRAGRAAPFSYQVGRTLSYAALGAVAGAAGAGAVTALSAGWGAAILSWLLACALLVAAIRLWRRPAARDLLPLRAAPRRPSLAARLIARLPKRPLIVGAASALLPCGALAAAVVLAAATASPLAGAAVMIAFATATGIAVIAAGAISTRIDAPRGSRAARAFALALAIGGAMLVYRPIPGLVAGAANADCPLHDAPQSTSEVLDADAPTG